MIQIIRSSKQLGTIIQRARKQRGMTQSELANLSGMRQATISEIERGHDTVTFASIFKLFSVLDLDLLTDQRSRNSGQTITDIF